MSTATFNPDKIQASRFLIELDALFDTRLAVLGTMGEAALTSAFTHGYYDRQSDNFPGVDYDRFKELYKARDKRILKNATITPMAKIAKEFAASTLDNVNNSPFHYKPEIVINVYPYDLSQDEINLLVGATATVTLGLCDIVTVNLSPAQLSPLYLKLNLAMTAIYDYDQWLEVHALSGAWRKHSAPEVTVLAPRISMIKQDPLKANADEAFIAMQEQAKPFIDLKLINVENFSIILKPEDFAKANAPEETKET